MRNRRVEAMASRWLALTSIVVIAACSDVSNPTGPTPRSTPSFAPGKPSPIASVLVLEPLLGIVSGWSSGFDISDFGVVIGLSGPPFGSHAVVWDGSVFPQDLDPASSSTNVTAIAPNGSIIVGFNGLSNGRWVRVNGAWVFDEIPKPTGAAGCAALDVASDGMMAGQCFINNDFHAVFWRNGVPTDLGIGAAVAVNAMSQVLVNRPTGAPEIVDVRTMAVTGLGRVNNTATTAVAINDAGEVVANAAQLGLLRPFLWTKKKGFVALPVLGSDHMQATGINNDGNVIGYTPVPPLGTVAYRSVVWLKSKAYELNVLPSYEGAIARAINAKGQIVGSSYLDGDQIRATLWTLR